MIQECQECQEHQECQESCFSQARRSGETSWHENANSIFSRRLHVTWETVLNFAKAAGQFIEYSKSCPA